MQTFRKNISENPASVGRWSIFAESKSYQKSGHFSKFSVQNDDVLETLLDLRASKLAESWAGWAGWLAGWAGTGAFYF